MIGFSGFQVFHHFSKPEKPEKPDIQLLLFSGSCLTLGVFAEYPPPLHPTPYTINYGFITGS